MATSRVKGCGAETTHIQAYQYYVQLLQIEKQKKKKKALKRNTVLSHKRNKEIWGWVVRSWCDVIKNLHGASSLPVISWSWLDAGGISCYPKSAERGSR